MAKTLDLSLVEVKESQDLRAERAPGQSERTSTRRNKFLSYVFLVGGLFTIFVGAYVILDSRSTTPIQDEWQPIDALATAPQHQPPLSWLWTQHNEHRIVFYKLLLLADVNFLHGRHAIYFWCILAVQCAFLWLLYCFARLGGLHGTLLRATMGLGAFCLFCPTQWQNFGWAFQISFVLPGLFFALSILSLFKYESTALPRRRWIYLGLSILAAASATYSNANGVLVWPLLLLIAAALRLSYRVLAAYAVSACILVGSYLYHYYTPGLHASPLESIRHPLAVLEYSASYLGVVLPPWLRVRNAVALWTGIFGLLAGLAASLRVLVIPRWRKPFPLALVGFILFTFATALITGLGRISFGVEQAFQSRYQTFNLLFWFATVILWLLMADEALPLLRNALLLVIPIGMLGATTQYPLILKAPRLVTHRTEAAAMALLTGVPDQQAFAVLSAFPDQVWRDRDFLVQQHLFMFSEPIYSQLNQPLSDFYRPASLSGCTGEVQVERITAPESVTGQDSDGLRVSGWADDASRKPVHLLVMAGDGKIVGFGEGGIQMNIKTANRDFMKKTRFDEWLGAARPAPGVQALEVYAVDNQHTQDLCHLTTVPVPGH